VRGGSDVILRPFFHLFKNGRSMLQRKESGNDESFLQLNRMKVSKPDEVFTARKLLEMDAFWRVFLPGLLAKNMTERLV
jgi:hypothetical protein